MELIVSKYNKSLKDISNLEQQPTYISELRRQLMDNYKNYRNSFIEQKVNGKKFKEIATTLNSRGFNSEQQLFLKNLRGENGKVSTTKISENIWKNLNRFIEVFEVRNTLKNEIHEDRNSKANSGTSDLRVISGIMKF